MSKVDELILKRQVIRRVVERLVQQAMLNAMRQYLDREEELYQLQIQEEAAYLEQQRREIKQYSFDEFTGHKDSIEAPVAGYCSIQ